MSFVLQNALVFDGTGREGYIASVLVRPPKIQKIFELHSLEREQRQQLERGCEIIDCKDGALAVCPGFIDMHAHSDLAVMHTPAHLAKLTQGVTTEVLGQDGIGYAPVDAACLRRIRQQIAGWNGDPDAPGFYCWRSVAGYLATLRRRRTATNVAVLVPQGNLRMLVLGYDARAATPAEIAQMQSLLRQALAEGAVGLSSGLTYVPGMYAADSELARLLVVVREFGGYYCPHHRSYGRGALQAYAEMIELARATGVRLHLTHAVLNFDENRGRAAELLAQLARARSEGVEITLDTYPYLPGATTLAALLPSWAAEGGPEACLARLRGTEGAAVLARIRHGVEVDGTDGCHGCTVDWATVEISGVRNRSALGQLVGHTIAEIDEQGLLPRNCAVSSEAGPERGCLSGGSIAVEPRGSSTQSSSTQSSSTQGRCFEIMRRILIEDNLATTILQHVGDESNVRAMMQDEFHCGGSDGILVGSKPHPRAYGTFTRFLGHYARELPKGRVRDIYAPGETEQYHSVEPCTVFPGGLAEAVAHLTGRPARVLGLSDRGRVAEGHFADLVVFDPKLVRDSATFAAPQQTSRGIHYVFVNGRAAIERGKPTHAREGRVLESTRACYL